MTEGARRGFPWGLTVACAVVLAMLLTLGAWQTQRMGWKAGLIAAAEAAATRPPVPLKTAFDDGHGLEFRAVTLDCPGLDTAPFLEMRAIEEGEAGVRLISACRVEGFAFPFLIDRGFVPETVSARPTVDATATRPVAIAGQLRLAPPPGWMTPAPQGKLFFGRDTIGMAKALGVGAAAPHVIFATTSTNPDWTALRPSAPPVVFSNNHLGYALTWFGLALALVGFYVALLRRRMTS